MRQSGNSFRAILKALDALSSGKTVTFISHSWDSAYHQCNIATHVMYLFGITDNPAFKRTKNSIFLYEGKIEFISFYYVRSPSYRPNTIVIDDC